MARIVKLGPRSVRMSAGSEVTITSAELAAKPGISHRVKPVGLPSVWVAPRGNIG
jgi:hypothetical protein